MIRKNIIAVEYIMHTAGLGDELQRIAVSLLHCTENNIFFKLNEKFIYGQFTDYFERFWLEPEPNTPLTRMFCVFPVWGETAIQQLKHANQAEFLFYDPWTFSLSDPNHEIRIKIRDLKRNIYRLNPKYTALKNTFLSTVSLPEKYAAVHIRRRDYNSSPVHMVVQALAQKTDLTDVFVMTDNCIPVIHEFKQLAPHLNIFHTCVDEPTVRRNEGLHYSQYFKDHLEEEMTRLFGEIEIASMSECFIGTGGFLSKLIQDLHHKPEHTHAV